MKDSIEDAIAHLENGGFVMVFDADKRENETDLVTPSITITPNKIRTLRKDAGGLICVTVPPVTWLKLKLPYLQDILSKCAEDNPLLKEMKADDIPYDEKSTFSLTINHRDTFTGIPDRDRALTIKRFAEMSQTFPEMTHDEAIRMFGEEFRSPGHVFLLNATEGLLGNRRGHTELTTALLELTDIYPSMTICEMLADDGSSLSEEDAVKYGKENDIPLIEGDDVKEAWEEQYG
ncbi:MAG: 3,4-dihydroxy-2-butanone-4-phosphate synthase [Thermoplasmata archaeon]